LKLQSSAFKEGERIPEKYTCDGESISPPLSWHMIDTSVMSWTLILFDPDAARGGFNHWVIYNLPPEATGLPEAVPATNKLSNGALQGKNDTLKEGYSGPCPPPGPAHHYVFTLYALSTKLKLPSGVSRKQLLDAMKGHIISEGKLIGLYSR
jgi:Raf kinase inhibitor-like YbhB/YbcL family protein